MNVHYYEDGNVQLNTEKKSNVSVTKTEVSVLIILAKRDYINLFVNQNVEQLAKSIIKEISTFDRQYHSSMNESYNDLAENTFKGLRRALPMTRNKMDWNKILNYKIGSELSQK